ncbi:hypothetical protein [Nocardia testacea]|uniref:hypothetical protein n=1 Tax=Nocardia testacea TaxID=248551 RepID=UPI0033D42136
MTHNNIDRVEAVENLFPIDGPHTPETLIAASQAIAELWRYLGHATISGTRKILTDPADAYTMVGALAAAERSSVDVLERLSTWARNIGDESTYTDRFGHDDPDGTRDQIQSNCHLIAGYLRDITNNHEVAAQRLDMAQSGLGHLYRDADDDDLSVTPE